MKNMVVYKLNTKKINTTSFQTLDRDIHLYLERAHSRTRTIIIKCYFLILVQIRHKYVMIVIDNFSEAYSTIEYIYVKKKKNPYKMFNLFHLIVII